MLAASDEIVHVHAVFDTAYQLQVAMDLMAGGEVYDALNPPEGRLSEDDARACIIRVATGLKFMVRPRRSPC